MRDLSPSAPYASIKDFGAKGDNSTNDQAAFTAAGTSRPVFVPEGTYVLTSFPTGKYFGPGILKVGSTTKALDLHQSRKLDRPLSSRFVVTMEDYLALGFTAFVNVRNAIIDNGGGYMDILDPGTYEFTGHLTLPDNCIVTVGAGVTLKRMGGSYIFHNGGSTDTNYGGPSNIHVRGEGTLDVNAHGLTGDDGAGGVTFVQCENVSVTGITIKNVRNWHAIEYQAVRNGVIREVTATDFAFSTTGWAHAEAFQLDLNTADSYRPCENILIIGCTVDGYGKLAGNHASRANQPHRNIRVIGNYAANLHNAAVGAEHWERVVVSGNTFVACNGAVDMFMPSVDDTGATFTTHRKGYAITNNVIIGSGTINGASGAKVAGINLDSDSTAKFYGIAITGNVLSGTNASGIRLQNCAEYLSSAEMAAVNPIWDGFTADISIS